MDIHITDDLHFWNRLQKFICHFKQRTGEVPCYTLVAKCTFQVLQQEGAIKSVGAGGKSPDMSGSHAPLFRFTDQGHVDFVTVHLALPLLRGQYPQELYFQ